jgi:hypothetical protein
VVTKDLKDEMGGKREGAPAKINIGHVSSPQVDHTTLNPMVDVTAPEQEVVQSQLQADEINTTRRATRDTDTIIKQLKLRPSSRNPCIYTSHYKGNSVLVERQGGDLRMTSLCPLVTKASIDDMIEETESSQGELFYDSDSIEEVV